MMKLIIVSQYVNACIDQLGHTVCMGHWVESRGV